MSRFLLQVKWFAFIVNFGIFLIGGSAFAIFEKTDNKYSVSPARLLEERINQRQGKAQEYAEKKYFQDNKVITKPFSHAFEQEKKQKNWPLIWALNQTRAFFQNQHSCDIPIADLSIILQEADETFRAFFYEDFIYEGKRISAPKGNAFDGACQKLSRCFVHKNHLAELSFPACQEKVLQVYQPLYQAAQSQNQVETTALGKNKYLNGMLDDSEFDLLYDISQVGKVMFEGFKAAPELVYYQMPLFNKSDEAPAQQGNSSAQTSSTSASSNARSGSTSAQDARVANWDAENTTSSSASEAFESGDAEVDAFIRKRQPQTAIWNEEHLLFQNQCVFPETASSAWSKEKQSEKSDFSPFVNPFDQVNRQESALEYQQNRLSDVLNARPNANLSDQDRRDLGKFLSENTLENASQEAKNCVQKCNARDKHGNYHYSFDERLICKMQCLCGEYSSPALVWDLPILEAGALRIRFCAIPAEVEVPDTSSKTIVSISEIMNEIRKVSSGLYGGGKLSVQKMQNEVLDSQHSYINFSKTAAFWIWKSVKTNPRLISPHEQQQQNALFFQNLQASKNSQGRNAYVLLGKEQSLSEQKATQQQSNQNTDPEAQSKKLDTALQTQYSANTYLWFLQWIAENQAFLSEMEEQLVYVKTIMAALYNKK